jgi:hypothetical protein
MATEFAKKLASIAEEQHTKFQFINEAEPQLCGAIKKWTRDIGATFVSCTAEPWSAVFISWCVRQAGATKTEFKFSKAHSVFVNKAIKDAIANRGVFRGMKITDHAPQIGDIIQNNRNGNRFTFDFAKNNAEYASHSVIVIETGQDADGKFAFCIGGNESDSVRRTVVRLDANGFIKQRRNSPFICVIKNMK